MLTAFLIMLLPTLFFYVLLPKIGIHCKSQYLKITFAWFGGMYIFTFATFFVAILLSYFTSGVLVKAVFISLLLTQLAMLWVAKDIGRLLLSWKIVLKKFLKLSPYTFITIFACLLFSILFYSPQLIQTNNQIVTSPVYWDFHWHAALIQNFVFGDNFPVQNEAFGGVMHTYHYFWAVTTALYSAAGLSLVQAINLVSIMGLFFIFIAILGYSEEFFQTKRIGILAILLTVTSSSLHFIYYIMQHSSENLWQFVIHIITNHQHPFVASFIHGNPFGYQGVMFNVFYFVEERQLLFGIIYLLLCTYLIYKKTTYSYKQLFFLGICMGAFFLWHVYITIMVLCALWFLLLVEKDKKKNAMLLCGFVLMFGAHYLYIKHLTASPWFSTALEQFPQLNFSFTKQWSHTFNLFQFLGYYAFSYGIKLYFLSIGGRFLWKKDKKLFFTLSAFILPTFILINTIQLAPGSISENHKWLRPMNVLIDIIAAMSLYKQFFSQQLFTRFFIGMLCLFLLTFSGIIELMPFLNAKPSVLYASYPSALTSAIRTNTAPKSIFVGFDSDEINLAGRKLFLGSPLGGTMDLKIMERKKIISSLYTAPSLKHFCLITNKYPIDYVEVDEPPTLSFLVNLPKSFYFQTSNEDHEKVKFIDIHKLCSEKYLIKATDVLK